MLLFLFWGNSGRTKNRKSKFNIVSIICLLVFVRDYGVHPRHPPRTFPLRLLAPRCLGLALLLAIARLRAGGSGAMLFGGRKESFPQLRLVSAGLDQPAQPTPFLVFISAVCGVAFATRFCDFGLRRRSSVSHGRPSGNVRGSNANALDPPSVRAQARSQRKERGASGSSLLTIYLQDNSCYSLQQIGDSPQSTFPTQKQKGGI